MDSQNLSLAHHIQLGLKLQLQFASNLFPNSFFCKLSQIHTSFSSSLPPLPKLTPATRWWRRSSSFRWDNWNLNFSATSSGEALRLLADSESIVKGQVQLVGLPGDVPGVVAVGVQLLRRATCGWMRQLRTKWPLNDFWLLHDPNLTL